MRRAKRHAPFFINFFQACHKPKSTINQWTSEHQSALETMLAKATKAGMTSVGQLAEYVMKNDPTKTLKHFLKKRVIEPKVKEYLGKNLGESD